MVKLDCRCVTLCAQMALEVGASAMSGLAGGDLMPAAVGPQPLTRELRHW
jgi:hypothetical protein